MNCLRSLNEWSVELTVYQGQLHLVTFWEVIQCNLCVPHVRIHSSTQCAVEKAPTGSQLLTCYFFFFFFFFFKKYELIYEFGSEKYAEMGNLDLENLIKAEMDNFD